MKILNLFKGIGNAAKVLTTNTVAGVVKPLPLSGIVNELGEAVSEIKTQNNYKRLIKLAAYIVMGVGIWYLIFKGLTTMDQVKEILQLINEQIG